MGARRASSVAVVSVVGAVLLVTMLVTWASSIGPDGVLAGEGPATHHTLTSATPTPTDTAGGTPSPRTQPRQRSAPGDQPVLQAFFYVLMAVFAVVVLGLVFLLLRRARDAWRERRRPPPPPPAIGFDVLETPRRVAGRIAEDAAQQRVLLQGGTPRNGIVACWHRVEEQAAAAGLVRRHWETSAEFTLRVLELVDADSAQVARLGTLYREARFSDHPLDEEHRRVALAALEAIHAGLRDRRGVRS